MEEVVQFSCLLSVFNKVVVMNASAARNSADGGAYHLSISALLSAPYLDCYCDVPKKEAWSGHLNTL